MCLYFITVIYEFKNCSLRLELLVLWLFFACMQRYRALTFSFGIQGKIQFPYILAVPAFPSLLLSLMICVSQVWECPHHCPLGHVVFSLFSVFHVLHLPLWGNLDTVLSQTEAWSGLSASFQLLAKGADPRRRMLPCCLLARLCFIRVLRGHRWIWGQEWSVQDRLLHPAYHWAAAKGPKGRKPDLTLWGVKVIPAGWKQSINVCVLHFWEAVGE